MSDIMPSIGFGSGRPPLRVATRTRSLRFFRRHHMKFHCAALSSFYDVLGVEENASEKEIKSAFKTRALKLHPDVNKATDAEERFKEIREAYQILSDPRTRADHDRELREHKWGSSSFSRSNQSSRRTSYKAKPAYGLDDVLRDLGEVFSDAGNEMRQDDRDVKSLWDELSDLGTEFVEFLEESAGIVPGTEIPSTQTSSPDKQREKRRASSPDPPEESPGDDIEQILRRLKREMDL